MKIITWTVLCTLLLQNVVAQRLVKMGSGDCKSKGEIICHGAVTKEFTLGSLAGSVLQEFNQIIFGFAIMGTLLRMMMKCCIDNKNNTLEDMMVFRESYKIIINSFIKLY